ncbi:MAG: RNA degradosome polyphosphate kinase [Alphaproteobacteria bacterium]|nr:RNA degradosome polyphosphate kinase [Alphaproteobacteria bacterium]
MTHRSEPAPALKQPLHQRFINRELSWLAFNARVLEAAADPTIPLLERLNFLAISAANLDEFYMVRVAGLKDYVRRGVINQSIDGLTPEQELTIIRDETRALVDRQNQCWDTLRAELAEEDIHIIPAAALTTRQRNWLSGYFQENVFPVLTPIAIDPAHPFPYLPNLGMALIFQLQPEGEHRAAQLAIVPLPVSLPRFIRLPGKRLRVVALEETIALFFDMLFPGFHILEKTVFRIVRDSDLDIEDDDADDFMRHFERAVKQRRHGRVIRVRFMEGAPKALMQCVIEHMQVAVEEVLELPGMMGMRHLRELYDMHDASLKYKPFSVRFPQRINDYGGDCFAAIAAKDIIIHHPFETFDVVVQFLRQAAADPAVVSIKQTLYRTSHDSPIVQALIEAAEAGKAVTALVELKARFDEEANLRFARDMERVGVQVVYGFVSLKTHAKLSLVTRREAGKLKSYVHFGTGNYHPNTARLYTDLSFFTCDAELCRDAAYLFNFITGYAPPRQFKKLIVAPRTLRRSVTQLIREEIDNAKAGKPAAIWAKMNALVDAEVIDALYEASNAGVIVELVVRGICCLRPGVPGMSENIRVKSIIGRFLEHARIYCFAAGHPMPSPQAKIFIGSADWMPRNFDWRVEAMVPIQNPTVHEQVLSQIMMANLKDERNSWVMQPGGHYERLKAGPDAFSAHHYFITNPSLSGRGSGLKKIKSTQMLRYKTVRRA